MDIPAKNIDSFSSLPHSSPPFLCRLHLFLQSRSALIRVDRAHSTAHLREAPLHPAVLPNFSKSLPGVDSPREVLLLQHFRHSNHHFRISHWQVEARHRVVSTAFTRCGFPQNSCDQLQVLNGPCSASFLRIVLFVSHPSRSRRGCLGKVTRRHSFLSLRPTVSVSPPLDAFEKAAAPRIHVHCFPRGRSCGVIPVHGHGGEFDQPAQCRMLG